MSRPRLARGTLVAAATAFLAVALFSAMDALTKQASYVTPLALVVFLRNAAGLVFSMPLAAAQGQLRPSRATMRRALARSLAGLATAVLFFGALRLMPLAQTVALTFTSPFFMVAMSAVMLGEPITRRAVFASAVGFAGVLVMLAEHLADGGGSLLGVGLALLASVTYALSMILARRDSAHDGVAEMVMLQNAVGAVVSLPFAVTWFVPLGAPTLGLFVAIGAFGTAASSLLTWAYSRASASILGPFEFTALIWAGLFGVLFFAEVPSTNTLAGSVLIISGCLLVLRGRSPI
jgi:drug/metabolite transporter (DMT)-like permease